MREAATGLYVSQPALSASIREYRTPALLTPVFVIGEVIFEALIPYTIALLVNDIKASFPFPHSITILQLNLSRK